MPSPWIGLTTCHLSQKSDGFYIAASEAYVQAVSRSGGCPILIPLGLTEQTLGDLVSKLDGILFTGGGDIHARFFGEENTPEVSRIDEERDRTEFFLLEKVVQEGVPFLGICRGIQVVNVGLGGTLYLDIPSQVPQALRHQCSPDYPRDYLAHEVQIDPQSRLASILGERSLRVNSMHHQAVHKLAPGLRATAFSPDGLIEALELPGHPFGLAVQWHPECLTEHPPMRALFTAFVQAASEQAKKRGVG